MTIFYFDENARVLKKGRKHWKQFLLFLHCFQKTSTAVKYKQGLAWERVNSLPSDKILDSTKLKSFADTNRNLFQMMIPVSGRVKKLEALECLYCSTGLIFL